ncbi:MAG: signal recognition particle-docking protein FtsY [Oceanicaulis sp.]
MSWFKFGFGKKRDKASEDAQAPAPEAETEAPDAPLTETPDPEVSRHDPAEPEAPAPAAPELADPDPDRPAPDEPAGDAGTGETLDRPGDARIEAEDADVPLPEGADAVIEPAAEDPAGAAVPEPADFPEAPVEPEAPVAAEPVPDGVADGPNRPGFFARLTSGLKKSSSKFSDSVAAVFTRRKLDDAALEELEDLLIAADLGAPAAARVSAKLARERFDKDVSPHEIKTAVAGVVAETLAPYAQPLDMSGPAPRVVLFVGVNGSGKTTTLGKIAVKMAREGANVVTAAGDTFRAAAVEQLEVWSQRAGATFMSRPLGADAAGLAYDALEAAKRDRADALLIDTAGRLQNKAELMDELRKIVRVLKKQDETAPHHVVLVLDGTVGSNALSQAEAFLQAANVTGVIMTKLDGTAKGGALVQVAQKFQLPIHFIGVGEGEADLTAFDARAFARALAGLKA